MHLFKQRLRKSSVVIFLRVLAIMLWLIFLGMVIAHFTVQNLYLSAHTGKSALQEDQNYTFIGYSNRILQA